MKVDFDDFIDYICWEELSEDGNLSDKFIDKYATYLDFDKILLSGNKLSENLLEKYSYKFNYISWYNISIGQKLSSSFMEKFNSELNWGILSKTQKLSNELMSKYQSRLDWEKISRYQKLTEEFIEEFTNKVCWSKVSQYQELSNEFILRHYNLINISALEKNDLIDRTIILELRDSIKFHSENIEKKLLKIRTKIG